MFKIQNLILLLLIVIGSGYSVIADNKINEVKSNVIDDEFNQETDEELLDIPTFLRRQAN